MKKNPVVHFEMPYKNAKRASQFYTSAFGWEMNDAGADMGHYIVAITAPTDSNRMVKTPGTINGGLYNIRKAPPEPSIVIAVNDLKKSIELVKKAGGKILGKPQEIPKIGLWVAFKDTEGNQVSMLQPFKI